MKTLLVGLQFVNIAVYLITVYCTVQDLTVGFD